MVSGTPAGAIATRRLSSTALATAVAARPTAPGIRAQAATSSSRTHSPTRKTKKNSVVPMRLHHV